jgi:hypothetical protein
VQNQEYPEGASKMVKKTLRSVARHPRRIGLVIFLFLVCFAWFVGVTT